jgi:hypothetical protein
MILSAHDKRGVLDPFLGPLGPLLGSVEAILAGILSAGTSLLEATPSSPSTPSEKESTIDPDELSRLENLQKAVSDVSAMIPKQSTSDSSHAMQAAIEFPPSRRDDESDPPTSESSSVADTKPAPVPAPINLPTPNTPTLPTNPPNTPVPPTSPLSPDSSSPVAGAPIDPQAAPAAIPSKPGLPDVDPPVPGSVSEQVPRSIDPSCEDIEFAESDEDCA